MTPTTLPNPPNPASYVSLAAWQQAVYQWMANSKSSIETNSIVSTSLLGMVTGSGLQLQQGTVAAPPLSFAGDTGTGIYQPTSGEIAIATEGVQALMIDSSGIIHVATFDATTLNATTGNITTVAATTVGATTGNITTVNSTTVSATTVDASTVNAPTGDLTLASTSGAVRAPTIAETDDSTAVATTAWVTGSPTVYDNIGRNKLHNSMFNINQRGTGPFTSVGAYTADRWVMSFVGDTMSISTATLNDTDRSQIGDESALFAIQNTFTGVNSAADFDVLIQRIENVHRLSNQTVTVSFWAKAASGTPKVGVSIDQSFGTGGSPSSAVAGNGTAFTLSTTWTRYSGQFSIPSASGKTLGSNGNDFTGLDFWFSSGSTNNTRAGGIGVQTAIIAIWGVQLEIGSVATALEKPDPRFDLSDCQRFYFAGGIVAASTGTTSATIYASITLPTTMRAAPIVVGANNSSTNLTSPTVVNSSVMATSSVVGQGTCTASGAYLMDVTFTASADL